MGFAFRLENIKVWKILMCASMYMQYNATNGTNNIRKHEGMKNLELVNDHMVLTVLLLVLPAKLLKVAWNSGYLPKGKHQHIALLRLSFGHSNKHQKLMVLGGYVQSRK